MSHGWSCRGDVANAEVKAAVDDVLKETILFFAKYLK